MTRTPKIPSPARLPLPIERLLEMHDCLTLALDATESLHPLPPHIREARSYVRSARRHVACLMGGAL